MATKLVIVESPAKAKTIGGYLGSDYEVLASIGHIRDLAENAKGLPEEHKKKWWAQYAVDIDNGFEPFYQVPTEKLAQVKKLQSALKGKSELVLATDEDREGEAISWHLLQVLRPAKNVTVKRIAFHEITKDAIRKAIESPREVDEDLVQAQETRRILDRLYGYALSPVLWGKVAKNLSAGRVQSPAVKLIVERELARRNFRISEFWDLRAEFAAKKANFTAELRSIDGIRVASGRDFDDETGSLKASANVRHLLGEESGQLAPLVREAGEGTVVRLETNEGFEKPAAPFMTTTLQQDANRKFGYSADRTMRIAQTLYEGVDIGGESVGLITYMRTDSLTLSADALGNIRGLIERQYPEALPKSPVKYSNKVKNAQEAHEAIRPTDAFRRPEDVARYLTEDQKKLYTLIWQRTIASQMKPAEVLRTEVELQILTNAALGKDLRFHASGKQVVKEGFLAVYTEGKEDDDEGNDKRLPLMSERDVLDVAKVDSVEHSTKPPARYTDATLIKKLEEMGIGRPSTYASIISVIVDRGYVRKAGRQLVPTFRACMVNEVLDNNFSEVMDLGFTARMDEALDEISQGDVEPHEYLQDFFLGGKKGPGLHALVEERKTQIPYPRFEVGNHPETNEPIVVRTGRDGGSFIQLGDQEKKQYANIPDDLAPADLTVEKAIELLGSKSSSSEVLGTHPETGRNLLLKSRNGFYLEVERTAEEIERKDKPTWISLPSDVNPRQLSQEDLAMICSFPKEIGKHPQTKAPIVFRIGRYGPYIESGAEIRNVEDWRKGGMLTVDEAVEILNQPKGRPQRKAAGPLLELGELEGCAGPVRVLPGRFGPYVTDGEVNATIPRGVDPTTLSAEQAQNLLSKKREAGPAVPRTGKGAGRATGRSSKAAPAKPSAAKPAAPKSATPQKATAKKAAPKKTSTKKSPPKK